MRRVKDRQPGSKEESSSKNQYEEAVDAKTLKRIMKPEKGYTVEIKADLSGESEPIIRMYFEDLTDAFDKFVSVTPYDFDKGSLHKPFRDLRVTEASIIDLATGEVLVSSALFIDKFGPGLERKPGFYFIFPASVDRFEQECGVSFNSFKGYNSNAEYLLAAILKDLKELTFTKLTGYENLLIQRRERLYDRKLFAASFQQHFHKGEVIQFDAESRVPFQEDYFYKNPDEALHHLLRTDFNSLDELVSWEKDLLVYFSRATMYQNSTGLHSGLNTGTDIVAELHSARRNSLSFGWESYPNQLIYLEVKADFEKLGMHYPLSDLERMSNSRRLFAAGTYNDSYTQAEKVPGLLVPFEKGKIQKTAAVIKKSAKPKSKGKSL